MTIKAVLANSSSQSTLHKVVVNNIGGTLTAASPFTIKNEIGENIAIAAVDQLVDVSIVDKSNGSIIIWNADTNKYEVKPLTFENTSGTLNGGSF
jgi:hypothetical protein